MARTVSRRRGSRRNPEPEDLEDQDVERDDEDDEEEETPRRGRRSRNSGSSSRGSRRSSRDDDDEDEGDDEDEDDKPRRGRRGSGSSGSANVVKSGWDGYDSIKSGSGEFADKFEVEDGDDAVLVKILNDAPAASWSQHWIERGPGKKKSFACIGDGCPLCDRIGDNPRKQALFNVVAFDEEGEPTLKTWQMGPMVGNILKNLGKDKKTGPLTREDLYYSVKKEYNKKTKKTTYTIQAVKERDVVEDWDIEPLTEDELAEFLDQAVGADFVQVQTKRELKEIANEAMDDEDD